MKRNAKTNARHTPGPWKTEGGWITADDRHGVGREACVVAQVHTGPDCAPVEHADGNAELIAAAPELHAACRALSDYAHKTGEAIPAELAAIVTQARDAMYGSRRI